MFGDIKRSLQSNTWTSPIYICGSYWGENNSREEDTRHLFKAMGKNTSARTLIFQNADIGQDMDTVFSKAMDENKNIRSVTLRNLISGRSAYKVPSSVFYNNSLEDLSLSRTSLDRESCSDLSYMIREDNSLTTLRLDTVHFDSSGLTSILAAIVLTKSLKTLRLNNMGMIKKDVHRLLLALSYNRSITDLMLEGIYVDSADAIELAKFLQRNRFVTQLSLRNNSLDAKATEVLVTEGFLRNDTLQKLFLSGNLFGDEGTEHVVRLLTKSTTLRELCLANTKMSQKGCEAIAMALRYNKGLRSITMDGNNFEECGEQVLETLKHNMQLQNVLERLPLLLLCGSKRADYATWKQVDLLLRSNKANRHVLASPKLQIESMPLILEGARDQADVFFHLFSSIANHFPQAMPPNPSDPPRVFVPSSATPETARLAFPMLKSKIQSWSSPSA